MSQIYSIRGDGRVLHIFDDSGRTLDLDLSPERACCPDPPCGGCDHCMLAQIEYGDPIHGIRHVEREPHETVGDAIGRVLRAAPPITPS